MYWLASESWPTELITKVDSDTEAEKFMAEDGVEISITSDGLEPSRSAPAAPPRGREREQGIAEEEVEEEAGAEDRRRGGAAEAEAEAEAAASEAASATRAADAAAARDADTKPEACPRTPDQPKAPCCCWG